MRSLARHLLEYVSETHAVSFPRYRLRMGTFAMPFPIRRRRRVVCVRVAIVAKMRTGVVLSDVLA